MIEVYQYFNGLSPQIINDIFKLRKSTYNLGVFIYLKAKIVAQNDTV